MFVIGSDEIRIIVHALRIAAETYRKEAEATATHMPGASRLSRQQASRAEDLALKIEVEG